MTAANALREGRFCSQGSASCRCSCTAALPACSLPAAAAALHAPGRCSASGLRLPLLLPLALLSSARAASSSGSQHAGVAGDAGDEHAVPGPDISAPLPVRCSVRTVKGGTAGGAGGQQEPGAACGWYTARWCCALLRAAAGGESRRSLDMLGCSTSSVPASLRQRRCAGDRLLPDAPEAVSPGCCCWGHIACRRAQSGVRGVSGVRT